MEDNAYMAMGSLISIFCNNNFWTKNKPFIPQMLDLTIHMQIDHHCVFFSKLNLIS